MPGFLGGSTGGTTGTGGEVTFPREFIDPVTKLRVSEPQALVDTDFEYGLQPTKWETVELINNTPSFFSKGGDTTIPNITAITTNTGTREITVNTLLDHGLSVGIPINVTGTKSVTADGAYIIASIPTTTSFTYLCRDNQAITQSIEDLYTSIITGEFFQGSQIRVADSAGITTDGTSISTLTVTTDSAHGFKVDTPFYFLNLNSTISQEFQAANSTAKSFDSSNSATAQTFDGSNTLSSINIDWSNSATVGGVTSAIATVNTTTDVITVTHTSENFVGRTVGTPLYYNVVSSSGFFAANPRGVVFLKTLNTSTTGSSTFTVSETPDGPTIDIIASMTGTFQLANQARAFAGNNLNPDTQTTITLFENTAQTFDGANNTGKLGTFGIISPNILQVTNSLGTSDSFSWNVGQMVFFTTSGSAPTGLSPNVTYWVKTVTVPVQNAPGLINITLTATPAGTAIASISGGSGTQTLRAIGVSPDKDVFCLPNHGYTQGDMVKYTYPSSGNFTTTPSGDQQNYYYVENVSDTFNFTLSRTKGGALINDGSTQARAATSSLELKQTSTTYNLNLPSGWYWLTLGGTATRYWVDMDYLGGGWMCVASNFFGGGISFNGDVNGMTFARMATTLNSVVASSTSTYGTGTPASTPFWVSLATWQANATLNAAIGGTRQFVTFVSSSYRRLGETGFHGQRARWNWNGWQGNYAWANVSGFTQEAGSISPGLWDTHVQSNPTAPGFSTIDADNDVYGAGKCSDFYTNAAWWYTACWNGNFNGGGVSTGQGYFNAPYWIGSSQTNPGDRNGNGAQSFWDYGAYYVR